MASNTKSHEHPCELVRRLISETLDPFVLPQFSVSINTNPKHDWDISSNVALLLGKKCGIEANAIAQYLSDRLLSRG